MISIPRIWALAVGLIVSLITIPLGFMNVFPSLENPEGVLIFILLAELAIYFVLTIFSSPKATIASSALVALVFLVLRFAGCLIAAILGAAKGGEGSGVVAMWVGNPVPVLVQIIVLIMMGTHIMAKFLPEAVAPEMTARLEAQERGSRRSSRDTIATQPQTSATGGFVQVYSYEELAGVLRKTQGLEGFVIFSSEGLVVWRDLPLRIELDTVVARTLSLMDQFGGVMDSSGLTRVRRVMVESKDHLLFMTPLNLNFGLLMLFSTRTPTEEIIGKVGFISKTSREFLQWKYPALPLATGLSQERNPLITT